MVRQHGDPAADVERPHRGRDRPLQHGELAVDLDAQGLEGAFGRVAAGALGGLRQRVADQLDQACAGGERLLLPLAHHRGHNPLGLLLLAVGAQDADEVAGRVGVEDLGGADAGRLVHAHVERGVLGVGEAAVGLVELHGGDAQVEQDALHARGAEPVEHVGEFVVDGVDQGGALTEGGESLAGQAQRLLVPVQGDQPRLGEPCQQGLAVAAEAEGAVDDHGSRPLQGGRQQVQAPPEHHRDVPGVPARVRMRFAPHGVWALFSKSGAAVTHRRVPAPPPVWTGRSAGAGGDSRPGTGGGRAVRTRSARGEISGTLPGSPGKSVQRGVSPPASRHFSPRCRPVNQPACAARPSA